MEKDRRKILVMIAMTTAIATPAMMGSCNHRQNNDNHADGENLVIDTTTPLPQEIGRITAAVKDGDAKKFAGEVSYPLERPYPLRNITDSTEMVEYYPVMVDDSLRNVVARSRRSDWSKAGWRGWTLDAGQYLWVDGKIYAVPYISKAEKGLLELTTKRDLATLPKRLRKGWKPVMCLVSNDSGTVYRLDEEDSTASYRMMVYSRGTNLRGEPRKIMRGKMETEGSEGNRVFRFTAPDGSRAEYQADQTGEEPLTIVMESPKGGHTTEEEVRNAYWLDLIPGEATSTKAE